MRSTGINLQLLQLRTSKPVFRKHSFDGGNDQFCRVNFHQFLRIRFLDSTHVSGVMIILLVIPFISGQANLVSIRYNDEIAIINEGRESRFVFSAETGCNLSRKTAKHFILRINNVPFFLDLVNRSKIGFHCVPRMVLYN